MKLINIGFGNMVSANRLVAIVSPESAPIKRIIQDAKEKGTLIERIGSFPLSVRKRHRSNGLSKKQEIVIC